MEYLKMKLTVIVLLAVICEICCKSFNSDMNVDYTQHNANVLENADIITNLLKDSSFNKLRLKRSEDDCEKLQLCRLHARSRHSIFAAYELYFVNRETARLWDHRARSLKECNERYSCYRK